MNFKVAYTQMKGKNKKVNHDSLFNGIDVKNANNIHAKYINMDLINYPLRIGVADGLYDTPAPQLASKFWMTEFANDDHFSFDFLKSKHNKFCNLLCNNYHGSSTTFAGVIINQDGSFISANIGDSRIYKIKNNKCEQISKDHTIFNEMKNTSFVDNNIEYASIYDGLMSYLCADRSEYNYDISYYNGKLFFNEILLVTSDGLTDLCDPMKLTKIFNSEVDLAVKLEILRKEIRYSRNSYDDLSIVACCMY